MRNFLFIFVIVFPIISIGQNLTDKDLAKLYNEIISEYFPDSVMNTDQKKFGYILIQTDIDSNILKRNIGSNQFKYYSQKTPLHTLCKGDSLDKGRYIYHIYHEEPAADTIEIIFGAAIVLWENDFTSELFFRTQSIQNKKHKYIYNRRNKVWIAIKR